MTDQSQPPSPQRSPVYAKMAVVGCGLMGSSVIRAARANGAVGEVAVAEIKPEHRARIEALGFADSVHADPAAAVSDADLVIFAVPVMAMGPAMAAAAPGLKAGVTITDVGSVKGAVSEALVANAPAGAFVIPGHPVAGTEQSGPDAGFASLFENRWNILTPLPRDDAPYQAAIERLTEFWMALGARVEIMDAAHHDLVLAVTSHLPHLIAYNIVGTAADLEEVTQGEVMKYSAGGFRDFTRIAASDPIMWRDVFLTNKDAVLEMLGTFTEDLSKLTRAIRRGDGEALFEHFTRTRAIRRGIVEIGQDSAVPDFGRPHAQLGKKPE
jgi:cyclohexadieny/prephenate dehydrogenase